jgi:hypothetical protein
MIMCLWRRDALLFLTACTLTGPLVECEHTRWALCGVVWVHILPHWDLCVVSVRLGSQWGVLWCSDAM